MPFFKELTDITDPKKYNEELKAAFKLCNGKKFVYFGAHPKCPKRAHVLLVDHDAGIAKMLGGTAKAEGKCFVTEQEEIRFEVAKGTMKIRPLKKYVETFYKVRPILIPADEPEEGQEGAEVESGEPGTAATEVPAPNPMPPLPTTPVPPVPQPPAPMGEAMKKKMEFEEAQFNLRKRIEDLGKKPVPGPLEQLKKQAIDKAKVLAAGGKFGEATLLLNQLETKIAQPVRPLPAPPKPTAPSPKLSTYMNASKEWKAAKAAAADGVFKLKTAILKESDPELRKAVEAKINSLNSIVDVMDDKIITKIEDAGREADEERQAERNLELAKFANNILDALRKHPLADVADSNPFGAFTIRGPVETVLTKFVTDFGG